ncbi:hypothetical protein [Trichloromonas sp.]|uniref:hypothetical protein n=1 Tax=Trichloromonas sp. TaxID=3069249 RepID=UPI003D813D2D
MPSRLFFLILFFCLLPASGAVASDEQGGLLTFWPLVDYRTSPEVDYRSLHILGPIVKHENKGTETEFALRPLYYRAADRQGVSLSELLYPVASLKRSPEHVSFQLLQLVNYDFAATEQGGSDEFMVFPLVFYGETEGRGDYFAVFPFGGKILGRFWRDEIRFTLFPLYSQTRKGTTTTTNLLWPFLSRIQGEEEEGLAFWPFWGHSRKVGVYRKQFCLWPIFFSHDLKLDSETPTRLRAVFPFYVSEESPDLSSRTVLWPFFSHHNHHARGYDEWNFPMPLMRVTRGDYRHGNRFLPFYADEYVGSNRKRWFLWPIYKIEETDTEIFDRRRDRVLLFLYSDLEEKLKDESNPYKRRVALWPFFSYQKVKDVSHVHFLALLEPFFPESRALERNWSPLWRLYQHKWDDHGNSVSTLLWNLYWKEVRGDDLAMEVFPLFAYSNEASKGSDLSLLKGLFRYRRDGSGARINLLYLPWGISWGSELSSAASP